MNMNMSMDMHINMVQGHRDEYGQWYGLGHRVGISDYRTKFLTYGLSLLTLCKLDARSILIVTLKSWEIVSFKTVLSFEKV